MSVCFVHIIKSREENLKVHTSSTVAAMVQVHKL